MHKNILFFTILSITSLNIQNVHANDYDTDLKKFIIANSLPTSPREFIRAVDGDRKVFVIDPTADNPTDNLVEVELHYKLRFLRSSAKNPLIPQAKIKEYYEELYALFLESKNLKSKK